MAGSKREKSPGVWELRIYLGRDPVTNKKKWQSRSFRGGARAAEKALAAFVVERRDALVPTDKTVGWLLDQWLRLQTEARLSPTTLQTYRRYADRWLRPILGDRSLSTLTAGDVRELHARMAAADRADATVRQVHHILRGALAFALEKEWVVRNVAAIRKAPTQPPPRVVPATFEEVRRLLDAAGAPGSDVATCIALAATLGGRAGELCGLRWSDVDLVAATVTFRRSAFNAGGGRGSIGLKPLKSDRLRTTVQASRVVSIDEFTAAALELRWAWQVLRRQRVAGAGGELVDDPFVLSRRSDGGGPPSPSGYSHSFGRLRKDLGLPHLHLHSLRHFMVTHALDQGVPLAVASERAGHSSPAVTARIYTKAVPGRDREAAGLLGRVLQLTP